VYGSPSSVCACSSCPAAISSRTRVDEIGAPSASRTRGRAITSNAPASLKRSPRSPAAPMPEPKVVADDHRAGAQATNQHLLDERRRAELRRTPA
jgi:hypothetical protein